MPDATACPIGFVTGGPNLCVPTCPSDRGVENRIVNGEARCVYRQDETKFFALQTVPIITLNALTDAAPTLQWVQTYRPSVASAYTTSQADATSKTAALLAQIGRTRQVADAFAELQLAENARDASPQAYQDARIRYYTLSLGDTWVAQERQRVLNAEVLPSVVPYVQTINSITERQAQQATTKTAVDAVKSKLITLKDDFRMTTTTLMDQIGKLRNQIELEKRRATVQQAQTSDWFINLILIVLSLVVVAILVRRLWSKPSAPARSAYTSSAVNR
jgi:hypothetical protein